MSNDTCQATIDERAVKASPVKTRRPRPIPLVLRLIRSGFRIGGALFPRLAGRAAYKLWFMPTRFPTPASEQAALDTAEIEYRKIKGMDIATYCWGRTGPTVLLVHGWSGRGTQLGAFVEPLNSAGYRVLSFDCPAHGRSSGKQTTLYEIADALLALDDHYGPFDAVITHSFGGPCLAVAMQRGLNTSRVVSLSPPARIAALVENFAETLAIPVKAKNDFIRRFQDTFGKNILEEASMDHNVRELDIPALVIHDEDDNEISWREGRAVAQAWENASFIKTSKLGHRRILRDPLTIEAAVNFIVSA